MHVYSNKAVYILPEANIFDLSVVFPNLRMVHLITVIDTI